MDNPENKDVRWWIQHFRDFKISKIKNPSIIIHAWHQGTEEERLIVPRDFVHETEISFQYGSEPCLCQPVVLESFVVFHLYITL